MQHTATRYNTLQLTFLATKTRPNVPRIKTQHTATHCNTLQHTATHLLGGDDEAKCTAPEDLGRSVEVKIFYLNFPDGICHFGSDFDVKESKQHQRK